MINDTQCQALNAGVSEVSTQQLPNIRGQRLLTEPPQSGTVSAAPTSDDTGGTLVAVSKGPQSSAGYRLELTHTEQRTDHIQLHYRWHAPTADAVVATVVTSPCSVVSLRAEQSPLTDMQISAWIDGAEFGSVTTSAPR